MARHPEGTAAKPAHLAIRSSTRNILHSGKPDAEKTSAYYLDLKLDYNSRVRHARIGPSMSGTEGEATFQARRATILERKLYDFLVTFWKVFRTYLLRDLTRTACARPKLDQFQFVKSTSYTVG